jgi:hypothetical protein
MSALADAITQLRSRVNRFADDTHESLTINAWYRGPNEWEPGGPESDLLDALIDVAEEADKVHFVFGDGPVESVIHRNDLGGLKKALSELSRVLVEDHP